MLGEYPVSYAGSNATRTSAFCGLRTVPVLLSSPAGDVVAGGGVQLMPVSGVATVNLKLLPKLPHSSFPCV